MLLLHVDQDIDVRQLVETDAEDLLTCSLGYNPVVQINEWWFHDVHDFIREGLERVAGGSGFHAGIWYQGRLVGVICLTIGGENPAGKADDSTARIDYGLAPAYRGMGIMARTCASLIDYAFRELMVNRIEITPDVANTKSCAIPERLGFTRERVAKQAVSYTPDLVGDLAVYAIAKQEWQTLR